MAGMLIDNWSTMKKNFVRVMPRDYKLALKRLKEMETDDIY